MKQYWQKLAVKVDALTLRERVIVFVLAVVVLVFLVNTVLLDSLFSRQKRLADQVRLGQTQIGAMQAQIGETIKGRQADPDAGNRQRLKELTQQRDEMQAVLFDMQRGLVAPDKMTGLLEDILKRHGSLRLLSLKTLPVSNLAESIARETTRDMPIAPTPTQPLNETAAGSIYNHGVEIVLQGEYLEMLSYMSELESMPWHLFWRNAALKVNEYPQATLTLTLYTMSLDKKWLNL